MVEFPAGTVPSKTMSLQERMYLLQSSVEIIQLSHRLATDDRISDLLWYFRGYVQWHSLAVVVAELGWNANQNFSNDAWAVLDPMLSNWDTVYNANREDPSWNHVNDVIERARSLRLQSRTYATAARRTTVANPRPISSVDVLLGRTSSTDASAGTVHPIRTTAADAAAEQYYATPETDSHVYQRETWTPHQQQPIHFQQSPLSQHQTSGVQESNAYTSAGAVEGFDMGSSAGFDDINFNAFNEVFSSQIWNHYDPMEHYTPQLYEPSPYAA